MRHLEKIASLLFAEEPRAKAEKILGTLIAESDARGGAVLRLRNDRLVLFVGQDLALSQLAAVETHWAGAQAELAEGRAAEKGDLLLAPLVEATGPVGVLVLEGPRTFDLQDTEVLRALLARALASRTAAGAPLGVSDAALSSSPVPAHEVERQRLIDTLQRHEWNIALVARRLGVTRRTVYLRMERYGIERQRVPKTLKRVNALA